MNGLEFSHNSEFTGSGNCNILGDCGSYKLAGLGGLVDTGGYYHDEAFVANGSWADVFSGPITVTGGTFLRINGSCIRYETMAAPGVFTHNVCITPGAGGGYQGGIIGACGHDMITVDYNYVTENQGFPAIGVGDDFRSDCGGHNYVFEGSHNIVGVLTTGGVWGGGWRYGAGCISACGTQTSYASSNNTFYAPSTSQAFINQSVAGFNAMSLAGAQGTGQESGSTIAAGAPSAVPSGCTGDGTYGIGCKGSGM